MNSFDSECRKEPRNRSAKSAAIFFIQEKVEKLLPTMKDKSGSSEKVKGKRSKDAADSEDQPDMKLIAEKTIDDEASFTDEEFDGNFSTEFDDSNDEQWKEENESWANSDDEEEELDLQTKYLAPSDSEEDDFVGPSLLISSTILKITLGCTGQHYW